MNRVFAPALLAGVVAASIADGATISLYISPPGVYSSDYRGDGTGTKIANQTTPFTAIIDTFDALTPGNRNTPYGGVIGNYTNPTSSDNPVFNVQAPNQYSGASDGTSTTNYIAIGAQSGNPGPVVVDLGTGRSYFGMWWSAGDPNNRVRFYSGGQLLTEFTSDVVTTLLGGGGSVTAVDAVNYLKDDYYGNPNPPLDTGTDITVRGNRRNNGEAYAYLHFVLDVGTFDSLELDNSGTTGTGFEMDNLSVRTAPLTPPDFAPLVLVELLPVPEPGLLLLWAAAAAGGFRLLRRPRITAA